MNAGIFITIVESTFEPCPQKSAANFLELGKWSAQKGTGPVALPDDGIKDFLYVYMFLSRVGKTNHVFIIPKYFLDVLQLWPHQGYNCTMNKSEKMQLWRQTDVINPIKVLTKYKSIYITCFTLHILYYI